MFLILNFTVFIFYSSFYIINSNNPFDDISDENYHEKIENLIHDESFIDSKNIFIQWIVENRGHLPGMVLNQYNLPIQINITNLKSIISLNIVENDENKKFLSLLEDYLDFENEFLLNLV